jgi:glucosamine-6-phosphate deaminase
MPFFLPDLTFECPVPCPALLSSSRELATSVTVSGMKKARLFVLPDRESALRGAVAIWIQEWIRAGENRAEPLLALPTGRTMLRFYELALDHLKRFRESHALIARTHFVHLDEYLGLSPNDPRRFSFFIEQQFLKHLPVAPASFASIHSTPQDTQSEVMRIRQHLERLGGIDLILFGIGRNGHIAFNEPGSLPSSTFRRIELTHETLVQNFGEDYSGASPSVPRAALTLGIQEMVQARMRIGISLGQEKHPITHLLLRMQTPLPVIPASYLMFDERTAFFVDKDCLVPKDSLT